AEMACEDTRDRAPKHERALAQLRTEIARLSNFAAELMTFSKGVVPRTVMVELNELVSKITSLGENAALEVGAKLELHLPETPIRAEADPQLLHVALSNLVTNALEAVSSGASGLPRVEISLRADGPWALLEVSDNGPGVSADMVGRLFEPFQSGK